MWDELVKHLADFESAVLASVDDSGYPFSFRCNPVPEAPVLRVQVPDYARLQPGPAALLCHRHDERLWDLKSFIVRGGLEQDAQGWLFRPQQFTPGAGIGGVLGMVKFVRDGRRSTQHYLDQRGLARPHVEWDQIHTIWHEIKREG